jgi:preprotein translocase subunit SecD
MSKSWWSKFFILAFVVILSAVYVYPTVSGMDLEKTKFPFKQKVNMGLDLQGGVYMVLGIDFNRVFKEIVERQGQSMVTSMKEKGVNVKNVVTSPSSTAEDPQIKAEVDAAQVEKFKAALKENYWTLRVVDDNKGKNDVFTLGISREYKVQVKENTLTQSIEVIRNRIDEFGVTEPSITSQGTDRVVVELPGVKDVDRAKGLIGQTAKLEFRIVNDKAMGQAQLAALIQQIEEENKIAYIEGSTKFSEYTRLINEKAKSTKKIPEDSEIAFERVKSFPANSEGGQRVPYLIFSKTDLTGNDLQDAGVGISPETQRPEVTLTFNPKGANLFADLTGAHVHERLAIVLDGVVHSAPVLNQKITGGRAVITLGQNNHDRLMQEAKDLSTVLRAGALPAQLEFLEQRIVGPSLGEDSIQKGAKASLIGALAVFVFIILYYRVSGVIAAISLALNVLFVLAFLVGLEATLTLPGIAGIALTVGIAVDSNIVIFERIREELRAGKNIHGAIEGGFQKALRTIIDANVTNAAAATILLMYGTGPIKGFAVTMLIGIITTLFTAVFVCKILFDLYLKRLHARGAQTISI